MCDVKTIDVYTSTFDPRTGQARDVIDASQITRNVFLGSYKTGACARDGLRVLGITHNLILGDAETMPLPFPNEIEYKFIQLSDHPRSNIGSYFAECIEFIQKAVKQDKKVLVNCWAGVSRSATIVIAYLITAYCLSYLEAYETVRKGRHWINPNAGFRNTLISWSASHGRPISKSKLAKYDTARSLLRQAYLNEPPGLVPADEDKVHEIFREVFGPYHVHTSDLQDEILLR